MTGLELLLVEARPERPGNERTTTVVFPHHRLAVLPAVPALIGAVTRAAIAHHHAEGGTA